MTVLAQVTAVVQFQSLVQELPYAVGATKKKKKVHDKVLG